MNQTKSRKSFTLIISILAIIFVLGLAIGIPAGLMNGSKVIKTLNADKVITENGDNIGDGGIHDIPMQMVFTPRVNLAGSGSETIEPISAIISAAVSPFNAADKSVDWSLAFVNASSEWATGKTVTDYVTVTPDSDGALVARVTCLQPFGEQIRLTATSRDNSSATVSCLIDYKQQFLGYEFSISQTGKSPVMNNETLKGTVFADFNNEAPLVIDYTYRKSATYTVALTDAEVKTPVLTVEYKTSLRNALNNAKANSAKLPTIVAGNKTITINNLLSKDFITGYTPNEINGIISAIDSNKSNGVNFIFKDGDGNTLLTYVMTIDVIAIKNQIRVTGLSLNRSSIIFGEEEAKTYNINYVTAGSTQSKLFMIGSEYGLSKMENGSYPETYTAGEAVAISNLKSTFKCGGPGSDYHSGTGSGQAEYSFGGWYLDANKTISFNGTIPANTVGDITLYADIQTVYTHWL